MGRNHHSEDNVGIGFTLIELLVAIAIIGILAGSLFAVLNPISQFQKANDSKRKSDLKQIQNALELYYQDNNAYPLSEVSNSVNQIKGFPWGSPWPPYIGTLPKDPSSPSKNYAYSVSSDGQTYYLYASLDKSGDSQQCNGGNACASLPSGTTCGTGTCSYGVSSPNVDVAIAVMPTSAVPTLVPTGTPKPTSTPTPTITPTPTPSPTPTPTPPPPTTFNATGTGATGTIQTYTVPVTGTYTIEAWGAQGGGGGYTGGLGAKMRGDVVLTAGTVLKILVGQQGGGSYGGGGGGSFVTKSDNTPLVVAGGGSSLSPWNTSVSAPGVIETSGTGGTNGAGGSSGSGGSGYNGSPGGAGLTGNGGASTCASAVAPLSFINGGTGGTTCNGIGGFGGGSGSDGCCLGQGGPGGGYSGGGASSTSNTYGGGGGSYNGGTNQTNTAGVQTGNGRVVITKIN